MCSLIDCRWREVSLNQPVAKGLSHLFQDHQKGTWKIGMCYTCWLYCALAWCYFPVFWLRDCFIYFELMIAVINKSMLIAVRADGVHCHCGSESPSAVCGAASKWGKTIQNFFLPVESWSTLFFGAQWLSCYSELENVKCLRRQTVLKRAHAFILYIFYFKKINRQSQCFSFMVNHWETFSERRTCVFAGTLLYIQHGTLMDCGRELFILKALV